MEYPDHIIEQFTTTMDVFGGYGQGLAENLSKVVKRKSEFKAIITNMPIITFAANLS